MSFSRQLGGAVLLIGATLGLATCGTGGTTASPLCDALSQKQAEALLGTPTRAEGYRVAVCNYVGRTGIISLSFDSSELFPKGVNLDRGIPGARLVTVDGVQASWQVSFPKVTPAGIDCPFGDPTLAFRTTSGVMVIAPDCVVNALPEAERVMADLVPWLRSHHPSQVIAPSTTAP